MDKVDPGVLMDEVRLILAEKEYGIFSDANRYCDSRVTSVNYEFISRDFEIL